MRVLVVSDAGRHSLSSVHDELAARGWTIGQAALGPMHDGLRAPGAPRGKLGRYVFGPAFLARFRDRIAAFAPDIIHVAGARSNLIQTIVACRSCRSIPIVHERGAIGGLNPLSPLDWTLFRHPSLTKLIVPSKAVLDNWMGNRAVQAMVRAERCEVVPHAVDLPPPVTADQRRSLRLSLGIDPHAFVVGTACTIRPIKNIAFAARAVAAVRGERPIVFVVIGPEHRNESVMRPIREAGGARLRLLGHRPHAASLLAAIDLYVSPTRAPGEGFGLAFAEAMACGVPGITMRYGASAEVCENDISGLAIPEESNLWTAAIERLIGEPDVLRCLGEAARERIALRYSARAIADHYQRVCADAVLLRRRQAG